MASLNKFKKPDPPARISVSIKQSQFRELVQYQAFLEDRDSVAVKRGELSAEMLMAWIAQDKDYQKWVTNELNAGASALQAKVEGLLNKKDDDE